MLLGVGDWTTFVEMFTLLFVLAAPFAVIGGVLYAIHRWGRKNDPMKEAAGAPWHTTGLPRRFPEDER
jgi:hypothetical protein